MNIVPVYPLEVDGYWTHLAEGMERACRKARCNRTAPELWQACRTGHYWLHVAKTDDGEVVGGIIMAVYETPWGRTVEVIAICGRDLRSWVRDLHEYPWLKTMKIQRAEAVGRPGLGRLLKPFLPIRVVRHVYEMELPNAG